MAIKDSGVQNIEFIKATSFPDRSEKNKKNCIDGAFESLEDEAMWRNWEVKYDPHAP